MLELTLSPTFGFCVSHTLAQPKRIKEAKLLMMKMWIGERIECKIQEKDGILKESPK